MAVEQVLDDPSMLASVRDKQPHVSRNLGDLGHVFSTEIAQQLLFERGLRTPYVRLWRHGEDIGVRDDAKTKGGADERRVLAGLADPRYVVSEMRAGATLVFQAMSTYCPEVAAFCADLSEDVGCPVAANAFLTPPHAQGAPVHYDMASVFIRQLAGSKTWRLHEPPKQWPIRRSKPGDKPETPLSQEVTLHPGDCLYLPRGYYHEGITGDHGSVHITFSDGVEDHWLEVLHDVLDLVAERTESLRGRLPGRSEALSGQSKVIWQTVREDVSRALEDLGDEMISALILRRLQAREQELARTEATSLADILVVESKPGDE
ncbi:cupin domain-containing protein [Streptomyces sp. LX-29]|uniref:JmjC domain-containing protein n=1 Tax=Streptomyces sp. LX-29 TaxID=2900152 RepID=UPI00240E0AA0|nr:cupin domain-containing protein [Streptomyces sp. LX-29]WFB10578.1 cupin domain-containing protein [Streptomyces sp. LX-29]